MTRSSILSLLCVVVLSATIGCSRGYDPRLEGPVAKDLFADDTPAPREGRPGLTAESTVDDYVRTAELDNPELAAAFSRWKADLQQIPQVTALPDPKFTYQYYIQRVETRTGSQRQAFSIAQTFPWFGKLALRGDAAVEKANASHQQFRQKRLKLAREVKDAYSEYYYLARAIEITEQNAKLLKHIETIARIRYKTAAAGHPDIIRVQVEMGKLADRISSLEQMRKPLAARLNAAMNRPINTPVAVLKAPAAGDVDLAGLDELLEKNSPELAELDRRIAAEEIGIELAKKNYWPDVTLGMSYIDTASSTGGRSPNGDGDDPVIAMVSLNLPIWRDKLDAGVREARFRRQSAVQTRAAKLNSLKSQLSLIGYRYSDAQRKITLYRDTLLPKARQAMSASDAAYRGAKGGFQDLIDAQRVLLEFEITLQRAIADLAQRSAELEMTTGVKFGPTKGSTP
ncbi:MAG: TolC family protein [Phycisphaerae bacterium]|nr:TolC family protein [Phycisphaerae bacterium]MDP7286517.1 TolC family protein [Phycisphaerae bacterium]